MGESGPLGGVTKTTPNKVKQIGGGGTLADDGNYEV